MGRVYVNGQLVTEFGRFSVVLHSEMKLRWDGACLDRGGGI